MYRFFFHIKVSFDIFGMQFKNKCTQDHTKTNRRLTFPPAPCSPLKNLHFCILHTDTCHEDQRYMITLKTGPVIGKKEPKC